MSRKHFASQPLPKALQHLVDQLKLAIRLHQPNCAVIEVISQRTLALTDALDAMPDSPDNRHLKSLVRHQLRAFPAPWNNVLPKVSQCVSLSQPVGREISHIAYEDFMHRILAHRIAQKQQSQQSQQQLQAVVRLFLQSGQVQQPAISNDMHADVTSRDAANTLLYFLARGRLSPRSRSGQAPSAPASGVQSLAAIATQQRPYSAGPVGRSAHLAHPSHLRCVAGMPPVMPAFNRQRSDPSGQSSYTQGNRPASLRQLSARR